MLSSFRAMRPRLWKQECLLKSMQPWMVFRRHSSRDVQSEAHARLERENDDSTEEAQSVKDTMAANQDWLLGELDGMETKMPPPPKKRSSLADDEDKDVATGPAHKGVNKVIDDNSLHTCYSTRSLCATLRFSCRLICIKKCNRCSVK